MKVVKKPLLDWEPLLVTVTFAGTSAESHPGFASHCMDFLRGHRRSCHCHYGVFGIVTNDSNHIQFICEWLCDRCLPDFLKHIETLYPDVTSAEIGIDIDSTDPLTKDTLIVDSVQITMEDESLIDVSGFEIATEAVTVQEFEQFVDETHYVTTAHKLGDDNTYSHNSGIVGLPQKEVLRSPVCCVSFLDAMAYCVWRGQRLPTEAEWLAAAISDAEPHHFGATRQRRLRDLSVEWTSTILENGQVVVRRRPRSFDLSERKRDASSIRFEVAAESYDVMTSFRLRIRAPT